MVDHLETLRRVRRMALDAARRDLCVARAAQDAAAARESASRAAIAAEAAVSDGVGAFSAWLPSGIGVVAARAAEAVVQAGAADEALAVVVGAAAAERAVAQLSERRSLEARRRALRRAQQHLDEAALRRS